MDSWFGIGEARVGSDANQHTLKAYQNSVRWKGSNKREASEMEVSLGFFF